MTESSQHDLFASLIDDLANQGWSQRALFAPEVLTRELAAECRKRAHSGALNAASVGRGGAQQVQASQAQITCRRHAQRMHEGAAQGPFTDTYHST